MKKPKASKKSVKNSTTSSKNFKQKNKSKDKPQKIDWRIWVILGVVVLLIFAILINLLININGNAITGMSQFQADDSSGSGFSSSSDTTSTSTSPTPKTSDVGVPQKGSWDNVLGQMAWFTKNKASGLNPVIPNVLQGIFGDPVELPGSSSAHISAIVLTLCAWLLVFLTFSDIIASFSSFNKGIAFALGAIFATIMAQFNWQVGLMIWFSKVLNISGSLLVFIVLGAAFFAYVVSSLGLSKFKEWVVRRKAMIVAAKVSSQGEVYTQALGILGMLGNQALKDKKKSDKNA
jgi:hypothetical protein